MAGTNNSHSTITIIANDPLNISVSNLKGVGPKRAERLSKKGINTILDLFFFIPRGYEDRSHILPISKLEDGKPAFVKGKLLWAGEEKLFGRGKKLYKILIGEGLHQLELVWFNLKGTYFSSLIVPGQNILAYGTVKLNGNKKQMYHPDVSIPDENMEAPGFLPVYSAIEGVSNKILRSIVETALNKYLDILVDPVPPALLEDVGLPGLKETIRSLHFPKNKIKIDHLKSSDTNFHKRLIFDRFFNMMLKVFYRKQQREMVNITPLKITEKTFNRIKLFFPFDLTDDQLTSIKEIRKDLINGRPMNRLVMGDVGTGKTLIAVAAACMVIGNNYQAALMAPTQLLAEQHMSYFRSLSPDMGFKPVILTGNLKKPERDEIYESVEKGLYNIIIGTHSLIQDNLIFHNLGLVIIDEQHRFGVRQRSMIIDKGRNTHVLTMSATPIPRTIAITLYGDRDISIIKTYPNNRIPITTLLVERSKKRWIFDTLKEKLSGGSQAYIICPLIDEPENNELKSVTEMTKGLKNILHHPYRVEYIHGQMDSVAKETILRDFRAGKINILVATTVIEVGIHVPNASLMIIEHPERLGLAQLHQLRGRIGRDGKGGTCILIVPEKPSEKTSKRLNIMARIDNGFEISQKDMEFRGHGEISGTRQSGFSEFEISDLINHYDLFKKTCNLAKHILSVDPDLIFSEHRYFKTFIDSISDITL